MTLQPVELGLEPLRVDAPRGERGRAVARDAVVHQDRQPAGDERAARVAQRERGAVAADAPGPGRVVGPARLPLDDLGRDARRGPAPPAYGTAPRGRAGSGARGRPRAPGTSRRRVDGHGPEADRPVEAGARRIVDDHAGVGVEEEAAGLERVDDAARDAGELAAVLEVVEDLARHDQVEAAGQRVAGEVEGREADVPQAAAALGRPAQRHGRDVGGQQVVHAGRELDVKCPSAQASSSARRGRPGGRTSRVCAYLACS